MAILPIIIISYILKLPQKYCFLSTYTSLGVRIAVILCTDTCIIIAKDYLTIH